MDGLAILQVLLTPFVVYTAYVTGKISVQVLQGKWNGIPKENAVYLFLIAVMIAFLSILGTINTLVEYWERVP